MKEAARENEKKGFRERETDRRLDGIKQQRQKQEQSQRKRGREKKRRCRQTSQMKGVGLKEADAEKQN